MELFEVVGGLLASDHSLLVPSKNFIESGENGRPRRSGVLFDVFRGIAARPFLNDPPEALSEFFDPFVVHTLATSRTILMVRRGGLCMEMSEPAFESWCFRNGGETYDEGDTNSPGLVCRFPDTDAADHVGYLPEANAFEVVTDGLFYSIDSLHQHADSWIDDDDRLHIDTGDTRVVIDPR